MDRPSPNGRAADWLPQGYRALYDLPSPGDSVQLKEAAGDRAFGRATAGGATELPHRQIMERAFGCDLGGVKAYIGRADELSILGARGAAQGNSVAFADTQPDADVVAHEVTHVLQAQRHPALAHTARMSSSADASEREAQGNASRAARGEAVDVSASPSARIHLMRITARGGIHTVIERDPDGRVLIDIAGKRIWIEPGDYDVVPEIAPSQPLLSGPGISNDAPTKRQRPNPLGDSHEDVSVPSSSPQAETDEQMRMRRAQELQDSSPPVTQDNVDGKPNVVFGHGYVDERQRRNPQTAICNVVVYGPEGSTLSRGVAKWVREKGKMPPGAIRSVTCGLFDSVKREFGGSCASFDRAVWEHGDPIPYPSVFLKSEDMPAFSLHRDDEHGDAMKKDRLVTAKYAEHMPALQERADVDTLYWTACQQVGDVINDSDLFILLQPDLQEQVYPPTMEELATEARYQRKKSGPDRGNSSSRSSDGPEPIARPTIASEKGVEKEPRETAPTVIDADQAKVLDAFPDANVSIVALREWAEEQNMPSGKVIRLLKAAGHVIVE